jgi:hypothetical protein
MRLTPRGSAGRTAVREDISGLPARGFARQFASPAMNTTARIENICRETPPHRVRRRSRGDSGYAARCPR